LALAGQGPSPCPPASIGRHADLEASGNGARAGVIMATSRGACEYGSQYIPGIDLQLLPGGMASSGPILDDDSRLGCDEQIAWICSLQ